MRKEYRTVAISCKAYELLEKIAQMNPGYKKYVFVSDLIEQAYKNVYAGGRVLGVQEKEEE